MHEFAMVLTLAIAISAAVSLDADTDDLMGVLGPPAGRTDAQAWLAVASMR